MLGKKEKPAEDIVEPSEEVATKEVNSTDDEANQIIEKLTASNNELTELAKRTQADFDNYRKRTEADMTRASQLGQESAIKKLLPIIDILDSAMSSLPEDLKNHDWTKGIMAAHKKLEKTMGDMGLAKQNVRAGDDFNHDEQEAVSFDGTTGDHEIVAEVIRPGYLYQGRIIRPAMVKVTKQD